MARYKVTRPERHPGGKQHVHWGTDKKGRSGGAINRDGTIRHGEKPPKKAIDIIRKSTGWSIERLRSTPALIMFEYQEKLLEDPNFPYLLQHPDAAIDACGNPIS